MIPIANGSIESNLGENFETSNFKIEVTSKTFSVLFDTLYQDKITSPMRELCTNAYDSHIMAGNNIPFDVTLPTSLSPIFSVRDYGTGLSHEDVLGLYTTAFGTTKDKTNDQVGYLGLGSKSFFAYTDSATISSWHNGEQRNYIASLDEKRIPQISFVNVVPSNEPNGLKVSYSCKNHDIESFKESASKVMLGFYGYDIYPRFNSNISIDVPILETDSIYVIPAKSYSGKFSIRQGCVVYPVSDITGYKYNSARFGRVDVIYTVPIGTVEVAASRESLSMDTATKEIVEQLRNDAIESIRNKIISDLDLQDSKIKAALKVYSNNGYSSILNSQFTWRGENIISHVSVGLPSTTDAYISYTANQGGNYIIPVVGISYIRFLTVSSNDEKIVRQASRVKKYRNEHPTCEVFLINNFDSIAKKHLQETLEVTDDQFIEVSSLEDPGPSKNTVNPQNKQSSNLIPYIYCNKDDWKQSMPPEDGHYYWLPIDKKYGKFEIELSDYTIYLTQTEFENRILNKAKNIARNFDEMECIQTGYTSNNLYLMTPSIRAKFNPPKEYRLDYAIKTMLESSDVLLNLKIKNKLKSSISHINRAAINILVGRDTANIDVDENTISPFISRKLNNNLEEKAVKKVEDMKVKYPMLFATMKTEEVINEYIKISNKRKNG